MPSRIATRRAHGFRPQRYTPRHAEVAALLARGLPRDTVAAVSGYSPGHVSRIARMAGTRGDVARLLCATGVILADIARCMAIAKTFDPGARLPQLRVY